jgi:hypothetical protein
MKKTALKKMTLSRETLAVLTDPELKEEIQGGATARCTTSVQVCSP